MAARQKVFIYQMAGVTMDILMEHTENALEDGATIIQILLVNQMVQGNPLALNAGKPQMVTLFQLLCACPVHAWPEMQKKMNSRVPAGSAILPGNSGPTGRNPFPNN